MRVLIGSETQELDEVLGAGGEATVYRLGDRAVKIFHAVDPAKLKKLAVFPRDLPKEVVAPEALVLDPKTKAPIGYAMPAIQGAHELSELLKKSFRQGRIADGEVFALFGEIHRVLTELHAKRAVVGDLNEGNLLFAGARPWLIDVDSIQLPGHPCTVAHERYLDPLLYGADLSASCCFSEDTDWYAFAVLLFSALLYVHPYGGVHPQHRTLLRRAEAKVSVLSLSVKLPKAAEDPRTLPAPLFDRFQRIFEQGERGRFPRVLLDSPGAAQRPTAKQWTVSVNRGCKAIRIFQTRGVILAAKMQPSLAWLYQEDGVVRREDGSRVMERAASPGMQFAIAGARTWVGFEGKLACVERGQIVDRAVSSGSFDATTSGCFLQQDGWLIERETQQRIGKVLDGRTFIRSGRSLGFGCYRAGRTLFSFLFRPGRAGLIDVRLPSFAGKPIAIDAAFDDRHAAVSFLYDENGVRRGALHLVRDDGTILTSLEGSVEEEPILGSTRGRAVQHGRILVATDEGLLLLGSSRTVFADTEPFVEQGAELLPGPNGTVYAITAHEITQLEAS